jgi:hypothetical protein
LFEGGEAHGGSTFCCIASMWLLQQNTFVCTHHPLPIPAYLAPSPLLPPSINIPLAQRWCCLRVLHPSPSFSPPPNHLPHPLPSSGLSRHQRPAKQKPRHVPSLSPCFAQIHLTSVVQVLHVLGRCLPTADGRAASS